MRKQFFLFIFIVLIINSGCKKNHFEKLYLKENLQQILDKQLASYKDKFPGKTIGFGLYVKSAGNNVKGGGSSSSYPNVYVSSGFTKEYGEAIHFRGASTTKSFTAAGILKLHQDGKLNIDDLITDNIPGTNKPYIPATSVYAIPNKDKITIRLLLQHRAGVFDVTNDPIPSTVNAPYAGKKYVEYIEAKQGEDHTFTIPEMVNVVAENHLSYFEPGTAFHYSNTGFHLLTVIIERVSGKRYDKFLQDEFLTPLQLKHTSFPYLGTDQYIPDPNVSSWLKQNGKLTEYDKENISFIVGDGNIITTPADLVTWANALYGSNTILNAQLRAQMIAGIPTHEDHVNYGLGTELKYPDLGYGHGGAHPAYMTQMRYHPKTNTSYVVFCNFLNVDDFNAQGEDVFNIIRKAIQAVETSR
ncbi:MAG TPA: serine hydrolase domain-containing protein [Segetibacter sp.]|nr:serine hydrolase domain-containing protein [Segetibacter sp.]